jgi:hypothetical protein
VQTPVGVEKVQFPFKQPKFGGYKMSRKLRRSFVGLPNAKFCRPFSGELVFQQPRLITPTIVLAAPSMAIPS